VYGLLRRALFGIDPERAHELSTAALAAVQQSGGLRQLLERRRDPIPDRLVTSAFGVDFHGQIGMAAGFDKQARAYNALLALGFAHVEIGTVTPRPQRGNSKPRIERYPDQHALINWLGFPNPGLATVRQHLERYPPEGVVGANVGPNKDVEGEAVLAQFDEAARGLAEHVDYVAINVSSPNTPGLRSLQEPDQLAEIVARVQTALDDAGHARPVLLKLHPDGSEKATRSAARAAVDAGIDGVIATNTTSKRPEGLEHREKGGLSGRPLTDRATRLVEHVYREVGDEVPIVGVGGIETGDAALEKIRHGATVVQAYTGFVYRGPRFPQLVHEEMIDEMDERGVDHVTELVGEAVD
jgi:dihydroorotate dehydrogenase